MEFNTNGFQQNSGRQPQPAAKPKTGSFFDVPDSPDQKPNKPLRKIHNKIKDSKLFSILFVVLIGAIAVLIIAVTFSALFSRDETSLVEKDQYQVVALTDGQNYFGKITRVTDKTLVLEDVYYLNKQDNKDADASTELIKRGCEIHRPNDQMIIYLDQVNFWENIDGEGQVAKVIEQWKQQNPDGQKCNTSTATTQQQTPVTPTTQESSTPTTPETEAASDLPATEPTDPLAN